MYCKRYENLVQFFKMERGLVASTDIDGLMQTLNINLLKPNDIYIYVVT